MLSKSIGSILVSSLACCGLLVGIVMEKRTHLTPEQAEPYHQRAAAAIGNVSPFIDYWTGAEERIPAEAVKILRPNKILSRHYVDNKSSGSVYGFPAFHAGFSACSSIDRTYVSVRASSSKNCDVRLTVK